MVTTTDAKRSARSGDGAEPAAKPRRRIDTGPNYWEPSDCVWRNPWRQSNQPCVKGSRVPTGIIQGLHSVNMDIEENLEYYEGWGVAEIEAALAWEGGWVTPNYALRTDHAYL